jgi:hypothetical protein
MDELQPGLWHWQAPHPDWEPGEAWPQEVSSYAIDDGTRLLFFDPLAVPDELLSLAAEREPVVVLTSPWHERDAERLTGTGPTTGSRSGCRHSPAAIATTWCCGSTAPAR